MKITNKSLWIFALLALLAATALVKITFTNTVYLPLVANASTPTNTLTPSATPTLTPTVTTTPSSGIVIVEVVQSDTEGNPLDEYISLYNYGSSSEPLTGWFLRDDGPNKYNFPDGFYIGAKKTIRVWTRDGVDTYTDLFWNSPVEVWNDYGDCAYLRDDSEGENELIDVYCYTVTNAGTVEVTPNPEQLSR